MHEPGGLPGLFHCVFGPGLPVTVELYSRITISCIGTHALLFKKIKRIARAVAASITDKMSHWQPLIAMGCIRLHSVYKRRLAELHDK